MSEQCWFCQRREADPSTALLVEVRKETRTEIAFSKFRIETETKKFVVPRCRQCASNQKRANRSTWVVTAAALLSGVAGGIGAARISSNANSDWMPFLGCTAGVVVFLALYFFLWSNRLKRLSPEQRQDAAAARKSYLDYPEVALERNSKREKGVQVFFKAIG